MDTEKSQIVAGVFVIVLTVVIILAIIWLSSGFSVTGYTTYQVNMQESVSGLSVDAAVEFNGVNVGRVKSVRISHHNPRLVELLLSIQSTTPITMGTRAMLTVRGLTGISYISLKDRGENLTPLHAQHGQTWPIIPTEPSLFLQMDAALGKLNENVSAATKAIRALLNQQNLDRIASILQNTDRISADFVQYQRQVSEILNNTTEASRQFPALLSGLNQSLASFTTLSDEIRENPALLIRGRASSTLGPGES